MLPGVGEKAGVFKRAVDLVLPGVCAGCGGLGAACCESCAGCSGRRRRWGACRGRSPWRGTAGCRGGWCSPTRSAAGAIWRRCSVRRWRARCRSCPVS